MVSAVIEEKLEPELVIEQNKIEKNPRIDVSKLEEKIVAPREGSYTKAELETNPDFAKFLKLLKMNVPLEKVLIKVKVAGFKDEDILHFVSPAEADRVKVKTDDKAKQERIERMKKVEKKAPRPMTMMEQIAEQQRLMKIKQAAVDEQKRQEEIEKEKRKQEELEAEAVAKAAQAKKKKKPKKHDGSSSDNESSDARSNSDSADSDNENAEKSAADKKAQEEEESQE